MIFETMRPETTDSPYRAAIFYVQQSPRLNMEIIDHILRETEKHLEGYEHSNATFHLIFFNSSSGDLMKPGQPFSRWSGTKTMMRAFLSDFTNSNYSFSKILPKLLQTPSTYPNERVPTKNDLCVIIEDNDGIDLDSRFTEQILKRCKRLLKIKAESWDNALIEEVRKT